MLVLQYFWWFDWHERGQVGSLVATAVAVSTENTSEPHHLIEKGVYLRFSSTDYLAVVYLRGVCKEGDGRGE